MKYAIDIGSGVMIYIRSILKTGSDIQKLFEVGTQAEDGDRISLLLFFKIKKEG
jgi:hypothetical protein